MSKKLIAACMAIAAFAALAMASTASAAPVITQPTGTVLATGTTITETGVGITTFTSSSLNTECSSAILSGQLKINSTAAGFQSEITSATYSGTATGGDCTDSGSFFTGALKFTPETGTNGLPWCLKSAATGDNFELTGGACGSARPIRFVLDLTGLVTCVYERTGALTGTFTTDTVGGDATRKLASGQTFTRVSGLGCPSSGEFDMEFTETAGGNPIYISS